jgi:hypothetical protein
MIASVLISVVSAGLLVYWFRYTCLLILQAHSSKDHAAGLVAANSLKYPEVQARLLQGASAVELPVLQRSLESDYVLVTYLMKHTAGLRVGGVTIEQRMLMIDFEVMRLVCWISRRLAVPQARAALTEMSGILGHLAGVMGERLQSTSRA